MQRSRNHFLAGTALASDQHRGFGIGDAVDQIPYFLERGACPNEFAVRASRAALQAKPGHFLMQGPVLRSPLNRDTENIELHGLANEVVGTSADRSHRRIVISERREHDYRHVSEAFRDARAELQPTPTLHVEVGHDDIEILLVQRGDCLSGVGTGRSRMTATAKPKLQRLGQRQVVIHEQYL